MSTRVTKPDFRDYYRKTCLNWLYQDTGDIRYAVVAIGRQPEAPPEWAIGACWLEAQAYDRSVGRPGEKPLGKYEKDGTTLLEIARRIVKHRETFEAAAKKVLGVDDKELIGRLRRVWRRDPHTPNRWLLTAYREQQRQQLEAFLAELAAEGRASSLPSLTDR